jgi:hypothetical protein
MLQALGDLAASRPHTGLPSAKTVRPSSFFFPRPGRTKKYRPDAIDPAIWRRFQLQIEVGLPGATERFAIVKRYIAPFRVSDETISAVSDALAGAAPALIREVAESIKRDLVLGPRLNHDLSPAAMFGRIRVSSSPAREMPTPPLWDEDASDDVLVRLSKAPWPPALETA